MSADIKINFDEVNLYVPEITLMYLENKNIYLSDKELGALARHILVNYFLKLQAKERKKFNFPQQINILKDLLVLYRTEQVLAGIYYWLVIRRRKMFSLAYLKFNGSMTKALVYFKAESLKLEEPQLEIVGTKQEVKEEQADISETDWVKNEFLKKFAKKGG